MNLRRNGFLLFFGFGAIIALMAIFGITSLRKLDSLAGHTKKLYQHPFIVSTAVLKANTGIVSMHRNMKDVVLTKNSEELNAALSKVNIEEKGVYRHFKTVMERFLGDKARDRKINSIDQLLPWH